MSLTNPIPRGARQVVPDYVSNGVSTVYPYTFWVYDILDLSVQVQAPGSTTWTALTPVTDFMASNIGNTAGGNITLAAAKPAGWLIRVLGKRTPSRTTSAVQDGVIQSAAIERDLDLFAITQQEHRRDLDTAGLAISGFSASVADIYARIQTFAQLPNSVIANLIFGSSTANPYGASAYPNYLYGVGGIGYYDIGALAGNTLFSPDGSHNFAKRFTYGGIDQATAVSATANSIRPGFVAGFTAPSQVAAYNEFGACALGAQVDSVPLMAAVPGTFTSTDFIPSPGSPIILSDTVRLYKGMWITTLEVPSFSGQIVSWSGPSPGVVTRIVTSGFFRIGDTGVAGVPTSGYAMINAQAKVWSHIQTTFLNALPLTGNVTNGSSVITGVSSMFGIYENGQFIEGPGIAQGTVLIGADRVLNQLFMSKAATATTANAALTVSCGVETNKGVCSEIDMFNNGAVFAPVWITDTGTLAANTYDVTNLVLTAQWRPGLTIYGTGPALNYVASVNYTNNSLKLKFPATVTGSGIAIRGINQLDECGVGLDIVSVVKNAQAAIVQRGSWSWGYVSHGAAEASFLCRPDSTAALPKFGFQVEGKINGFPTTRAFAVTLNDVVRWGVDGTGNETANSVNSTTGFSLAGSTVIDNTAYYIAGVKVLDNGASNIFAPTVTPQTGSFTTLGTLDGRWRRIGRVIHGTANVPITTNGTAGGYISIGNLPYFPKVNTPVFGRRLDTGAMVVGVIGTGTLAALVTNYDGTSPCVSGGGVNIEFCYEIN